MGSALERVAHEHDDAETHVRPIVRYAPSGRVPRSSLGARGGPPSRVLSRAVWELVAEYQFDLWKREGAGVAALFAQEVAK